MKGCHVPVDVTARSRACAVTEADGEPGGQAGALERGAVRLGVEPGPCGEDETALEIALTTVWMVRMGRRLGESPQLHELSAEQLIEFWAW